MISFKFFDGFRKSEPSVPAGLRVYGVGDIHGRLDLLNALTKKIGEDAQSARAEKTLHIFLGDYIDRGPHSADVISRLLEIQENNAASIFLRGNHEQALLDFLRNPSSYWKWCKYGAEETLLSYGIDPPLFDDDGVILEKRQALVEAMPPEHLAFFEGTTFAFSVGDYFFAHGGVRPGVPLAEQDPNDLMWIREEFLSSTQLFEKTVVHGHSPNRKPQVRSNRIGVDTLAYLTGHLTAVVLEGSKRWFIST
jgi:serine/threonine protein phosphatase 1